MQYTLIEEPLTINGHLIKKEYIPTMEDNKYDLKIESQTKTYNISQFFNDRKSVSVDFYQKVFAISVKEKPSEFKIHFHNLTHKTKSQNGILLFEDIATKINDKFYDINDKDHEFASVCFYNKPSTYVGRRRFIFPYFTTYVNFALLTLPHIIEFDEPITSEEVEITAYNYREYYYRSNVPVYV